MYAPGFIGCLSPLQKEYVDDILSSGRHLLNLVNNLLDLERVELGNMTFSSEEVDVNLLLTEVRDVLRTVAEDNRVTVSVTVDAPLATVHPDPVRLRQTVYNYLFNAIKFSLPGSVVWMRPTSDGSDTFRVEVADQRPGVTPEQLPSIFADFQQVDRTRKRAGQGAGLGLALTKRMDEAALNSTDSPFSSSKRCLLWVTPPQSRCGVPCEARAERFRVSQPM